MMMIAQQMMLFGVYLSYIHIASVITLISTFKVMRTNLIIVLLFLSTFECFLSFAESQTIYSRLIKLFHKWQQTADFFGSSFLVEHKPL